MTQIALKKLAEKMDGKILQGDTSLSFSRFNIDSRLTRPGELFFALVAERNGHDFVSSAVDKGAAGVVISRDISPPPEGTAVIKVDDTTKALQKLAARILADHSVKIVGITGSTGKTTTKEFTSSMLSQKFNVLKSKGNYNNLLGIPLTLLGLTEHHEIAVLEMGMSAPGEINRLTDIAPPDIAVITNIGPVHLEFFESLEDIARAKKELLDGTKETGTAVLNGDDPLVRSISQHWEGRKVTFGLSGDCDIRAENIQKKGWTGMSFDLAAKGRKKRLDSPFIYESSLYNYLASAGTALSLGLSIEDISEDMERFLPFPNRGGIIFLAGGVTLVDDSYNSNPRALESVLKILPSLPAGRKVAVLGDMLELGSSAKDFHRRAGETAAKGHWDILVTVGPLARFFAEGAETAGMDKSRIHSFKDADEAAENINAIIKDNDLVLVKGSRGIQTEKISVRIKERKGS